MNHQLGILRRAEGIQLARPGQGLSHIRLGVLGIKLQRQGFEPFQKLGKIYAIQWAVSIGEKYTSTQCAIRPRSSGWLPLGADWRIVSRAGILSHWLGTSTSQKMRRRDQSVAG